MIESLSMELEERRRLLGLSREEASKKFRVPLGFITAIERGRLEQLPATVYARGFLKSYCEGLGLAPEQRVDLLDEAIHRRPRFRVALLGSGSVPRPKWLEDTLMWAAIVSVIVLGWIAYTAVVNPGEHPARSGVRAESFDLHEDDPFAVP